MENVKAIDIMNYPPQVKEGVEYNFNDYEEWLYLARTTFKPMFPSGRFPTTKEEYEQFKFLYSSMFCPFETVADLVKAMDETGYEKVCICAVKMWSLKSRKFVWNFSVDQVQKIVERSNGRVIGAAGYDPFEIEESLREIERAVKEYEFRFVYFHTMSFGLPPNDKRFYPLYAKCNELGIPVSVQVGHSAEPMPTMLGNPMLMDEVAITFPNLKINLSHSGWPWFREWCDLVWKHPNVYGDISAYMPKSLEPYQIKFMFSGRGKNKVMWGTNGMGLIRGKKELMEMDAKEDVKKNILRDNAMRFLGLEE
jgi:predicted TIM-barrel fold metal-dependent hydrolase